MIPFNKPYMTGKELWHIAQAHANSSLAGDGFFTRKCHAWLEQQTACVRAFLTHSCTAALEMAAILADVQPGDEIILPSYTFVSTANAFVLRGGIPVFVDIRPDTLNIDESKIEAAITPKTKAIVVVHYAGVACELDVILEIVHRHDLLLIEDAAQALMSSYKGKPLGSFGSLAAVSFHETKNIMSGEGGALLINDKRFLERAEIIREKGTNRGRFFRGEVDKYTWVDVGSSYLPGELIAAFLFAQMEEGAQITERRLQIWHGYHQAFSGYDQLQQPIVPPHCEHNAHMYYLLCRDRQERTDLMQSLKSSDINAVFHYVPLHSSPAGRRYGRTSGSMEVTDRVSDQLLRLPLYCEMSAEDVERVVEAIRCFYQGRKMQ